MKVARAFLCTWMYCISLVQEHTSDECTGCTVCRERQDADSGDSHV